jgi:L-2-hydroxyglutarate oxidase LhgO
MSGVKPATRILPFRGEFYKLKPEAYYLVRALIYPCADPNFPFLGVHFTKLIHGGYECGPNAVLAWAREGYRHSDVNLGDVWEWLRYRGFWKMASRHWRMGFEEMWRSEETDRVVNVENAPSPAATASLNIGRLIVDRLAPRFE